MTLSIRAYVFVGLLFYLIFAIATVPATVFTWALARASGGIASIEQPAGSLWSGHGDLVVRNPGNPARSFGVLTWRIKPLWLATGRLAVAAQLTGPLTLSGDLGLGLGSVSLRDLHATLSPSLIADFYSPAALIGASGQVLVTAHRVDYDGDAHLNGEVELVWQNAGTKLSSVNPLGDYQLVARGGGDNVSLSVQTPRGDLRVYGQGQWRLGPNILEFNGAARAVGHEPQLQPLLQLLGNQTGAETRITIKTAIK